MKLTGNTIVMTGAGSGIGAALAQRFHDLGNTVTVAGRRPEALERAIAGRENMHAMTFDVESADSIAAFAEDVLAKHPQRCCQSDANSSSHAALRSLRMAA